MTGRLPLGLISPVLTLRPGVHAGWEEAAGIAEVRRIAEAADRLGYDFMTCSEHVAVAASTAGKSGDAYWDPLPTFGFLAAHTTSLRFATVVLVLPFHHPLDIAKRYGTLDQICDGRLILGVGVGYAQGEFEAIGAPFEDRGPRTDDAMRALRAAWANPRPTYDGEFYRFGDVTVRPHGLQPRVPLWVGGSTPRSLRRAVELGDGWAPTAQSAQTIAEWLATARSTEAWVRRSGTFDVVLGTDPPIDPVGDHDETVRRVQALWDAGATRLLLRFVHQSLDHYLEQLEAMAVLAVELRLGASTSHEGRGR